MFKFNFTDTQILKVIYGFIAAIIGFSTIGGILMGFYSVFSGGKSVYALAVIVIIVFCVSLFFILILGFLWRRTKVDAADFTVEMTSKAVKSAWLVVDTPEQYIYPHEKPKVNPEDMPYVAVGDSISVDTSSGSITL